MPYLQTFQTLEYAGSNRVSRLSMPVSVFVSVFERPRLERCIPPVFGAVVAVGVDVAAASARGLSDPSAAAS